VEARPAAEEAVVAQPAEHPILERRDIRVLLEDEHHADGRLTYHWVDVMPLVCWPCVGCKVQVVRRGGRFWDSRTAVREGNLVTIAEHRCPALDRKTKRR
jgi:hypothetical protein